MMTRFAIVCPVIAAALWRIAMPVVGAAQRIRTRLSQSFDFGLPEPRISGCKR